MGRVGLDIRSELVQTLRADLAHALIASDFDGTLAPIVPNPADSRLVPGALEALAALADKGAQVAIVTGREAETVVDLGGLEQVRGIVVAGLYGLESWRDRVVRRPDESDAIRQ